MGVLIHHVRGSYGEETSGERGEDRFVACSLWGGTQAWVWGAQSLDTGISLAIETTVPKQMLPLPHSKGSQTPLGSRKLTFMAPSLASGADYKQSPTLFFVLNAFLRLPKASLYIKGFPGGSVVKNPPAVQEKRVRFLGWEDPLEEEMATPSVFLPGKSQGQRSLAGYSPWGQKESDMTEDWAHTHLMEGEDAAVLQGSDGSRRHADDPRKRALPALGSGLCLLPLCVCDGSGLEAASTQLGGLKLQVTVGPCSVIKCSLSVPPTHT